MQTPTHNIVEDIIKSLWHRLTNEEIELRKERRDEFFMAIRKKHGVARAQAKIFLLDLEHHLYEYAA